MTRKKEAEEVIDPDALIAEEEAWREQQQAKRQRAIEQLLEQRRGIDDKLSRLGYQQSAPKQKAKAEGERKQRTCPRCGELGHRWNKCPNPPQASWAEDPRAQG